MMKGILQPSFWSLSNHLHTNAALMSLYWHLPPNTSQRCQSLSLHSEGRLPGMGNCQDGKDNLNAAVCGVEPYTFCNGERSLYLKFLHGSWEGQRRAMLRQVVLFFHFFSSCFLFYFSDSKLEHSTLESSRREINMGFGQRRRTGWELSMSKIPASLSKGDSWGLLGNSG